MSKVEKKICTVCSGEFPATPEYFYRQKDKLDPRCKTCRIKTKKKYNSYAKTYRKEYYNKNKNTVLKNCKKYRDEHKGVKKKYNKEYGVKNKERISSVARKYHKENRDIIIIKRKKYNSENKDKIAANNRNRRARIRLSGDRITSTEWADKILEYDGKCAYCDVVLEENPPNVFNPNGITQDHVIPVSKGGKHLIDNVVPCCRLCNNRKNNKSGDEFNKWLKENRR